MRTLTYSCGLPFPLFPLFPLQKHPERLRVVFFASRCGRCRPGRRRAGRGPALLVLGAVAGQPLPVTWPAGASASSIGRGPKSYSACPAMCPELPRSVTNDNPELSLVIRLIGPLGRCCAP